MLAIFQFTENALIYNLNLLEKCEKPTVCAVFAQCAIVLGERQSSLKGEGSKSLIQKAFA